MTNSDYGPELIRQYLLHELRANGIVKYDNGEYIFEGNQNDYLIEMKLYPIDKPTSKRLIEGD